LIDSGFFKGETQMPSTSTGFESQGISAHGTLVKRIGVEIGELKDITPPPLSRKTIETSTQNSSDDSYVVGIRRKGELGFMVNFLPSSDATHNSATGLIKAWNDGSKDRYNVTYPDGSDWMFSGFVSNIAPKAPVDGGLEAQIAIRPSGGHIFMP
jgi:hypothetical protein